MKTTFASYELLKRIIKASGVGDGSDGVWAYWLDKPLTKQDRGNLSDLVQKGLLVASEFHGKAFYLVTSAGYEYYISES